MKTHSSIVSLLRILIHLVCNIRFACQFHLTHTHRHTHTHTHTESHTHYTHTGARDSLLSCDDVCAAVLWYGLRWISTHKKKNIHAHIPRTPNTHTHTHTHTQNPVLKTTGQVG